MWVWLGCVGRESLSVPGEIGILTLPIVQSPEDVGLVGVSG